MALQVPSLVFGGGSPPDGDPKVMVKQPEDSESWSVQVPERSTAFLLCLQPSISVPLQKQLPAACTNFCNS
jgi:hypothetical protein